MSASGFGPVQACVFDAYGTLLDVASAVADEAAALGPRADALNDLWRRKQLEYTWLRSLMRRHADFAQVTADALDFSLEALDLAESGLRERLLAAYRRLKPYPDVRPALLAPRGRGMRTAILSNGSATMLADAVRAAEIGDLVDVVLSIDEVGVFKPTPEVYRLASLRLDLPAGRIAFVSANGWDVHGAASFGFAAAWVNRGGLPDDRLPGTPALTLADLCELPLALAHGSGERP